MTNNNEYEDLKESHQTYGHNTKDSQENGINLVSHQLTEGENLYFNKTSKTLKILQKIYRNKTNLM